MMTEARPPLVRPKPQMTEQPAEREWQDAFYIHKHTDRRAVNQPSYVPMGIWNHGPFSTYAAAVEYGKLDISTCAYFTVDRWYVNPALLIEYVDLPTTLAEEWSDDSQFAESRPGFLDET